MQSNIKPATHLILLIFVNLIFWGCKKTDVAKKPSVIGGESLSVINQIVTDGTGSWSLLGNNLDIDNVYAVAGDPHYSDLLLPNRGCIRIYGRSASGTNWTERALIKDPHPKPYASFGYYVAISGDYVVTSSQDSIYVFKRSFGDIWVKEASLVPPNLSVDSFGISDIDIYGDIIVAGQGWRNVNGKQDCGAVYFFKKSNNKWAYQKTVFSPNNQIGDRFGCSVSAHGNYALIGSRGHPNATHGGKAYIYFQFLNNWNLQANLTSPDVQLMDNYGCAVDLRGEYAVIGADQELSGGDRKGSAYIYKRTSATWTKQARLFSPDAIINGQFGKSVSINNDFLIIGGGGDLHAYDGAIYTYSRSGTSWNFFRKDNTPNTDFNYFGNKVAIDSTRHFVVSELGSLCFGTVY